jgi:hypothetical protein
VRALLVWFSLLAWSVPATAQRPVPGPAPSVLFSHDHVGPLQPTLAAEPRDSLPRIRATYWKEGALIGGTLGALGGALLGHGFCGLDESSKDCTGSLVLGGLLGAVVLAIPGALIGGQFSKEPAEPDPPTSSARVDRRFEPLAGSEFTRWKWISTPTSAKRSISTS